MESAAICQRPLAWVPASRLIHTDVCMCVYVCGCGCGGGCGRNSG